MEAVRDARGRFAPHTSPCPDLLDLRQNHRALEARVNDEETGLGALNRGLANSAAWQARIEERVNQLWYITLASALGALGSLAIGLMMLLAKR